MSRFILFISLLFPYFCFSQYANSSQPNMSDVLARSVNADNLVKSGQLEQALLEYDNILEASPDYVDIYMRRAVLLSRLGRIPEAIQDYNMAKQLDPYVVEVFDIQGRINKLKVLKDVKVSDPDDASKALFEVQQQLKSDPNDPVLYFTSANLKVLLGLYKGAIEDYNNALVLKNDYTEAIYNRGVVYVIINNLVFACEDFYRSSQMGSIRAEKKYRFFCKK
jgi:tetratricopeptide (TPR) repeat protein